MSYVRTFFERTDASAQLGRIAKPRCKSFAFFALKKEMRKPLLSLAIAFFSTKLLDNTAKIPFTESNAPQYQSIRRNVSASSVEKNTYAR